jgi:hypothetical protein
LYNARVIGSASQAAGGACFWLCVLRARRPVWVGETGLRV